MARETDVPRIKLELAGVTQTRGCFRRRSGSGCRYRRNQQYGEHGADQEFADSGSRCARDYADEGGRGLNGNSNTVINGLRTSYSNMTLDGINIQDNYIRDNALDYSPNKLRVGQVRQMTLITSNPTAAASGGATETAFSTPSRRQPVPRRSCSGTTATTISRPTTGSTTSPASGGRSSIRISSAAISAGPIRKDKLFFYASYEAIRAHQQMPQNFTILTPDARNGIFTYNSGGVTRKVNLLTLTGPDRRGSGDAA